MLDARRAPALSEKLLSWRSNLRSAVNVVKAYVDDNDDVKTESK